MPPFKLQPEDGFMQAVTCSCCVLLFNHILCNKFVLDYKFCIHFIEGQILSSGKGTDEYVCGNGLRFGG